MPEPTDLARARLSERLETRVRTQIAAAEAAIAEILAKGLVGPDDVRELRKKAAANIVEKFVSFAWYLDENQQLVLYEGKPR